MDPFGRRRGSINPTVPLSLEASLDEENREVLAKLDKSRTEEPRDRAARGETPPPPIRSMLNIGPGHTRHGSFPGPGVPVTSPRDLRKPSKRLDPSDPSTWTRPHRPSFTESPAASVETEPQGLPKIDLDEQPGFEKQYNFDMSSMPSGAGAAVRGSPSQVNTQSVSVSGPGISSPQPTPMTPTIDLSPPDAASSKPKILLSSAKIPLTLTPDMPHNKATLPVSIYAKTDRRLSNKSSSFSDGSEPTGRVEKDLDGDEDALDDSSDDNDVRDSSSDGESPETARGRTREKTTIIPKDEVEQKAESTEETDRLAPQSRGVRSLLDPLTSPSRPHERKEEVHPPSSFGKSGPTAADFEDDDDDEMEADIKKAKTLGLHISPVDNSIPDRDVRMIIRGEWAKLQDDTENSNHTSKLYLTCTDMSQEASYALEWTVGTMLRDGDTLLAIYAIEDEFAPKEPEGNATVIAESAQAAKEASDTMAKLTRQTTDLSNRAPRQVNKFIPVTEALPSTGSVDARHTSKKEMERLRSMDEITDNFLKLVRKTPLQVRCMVEVIHCKSPKHLILNAIDTLEPTLCIVGTRGRNSLKGVLLGSFSNYLVTKSSVPVMVARKRLKKPRHAKVNSSSIRLANNLRTVAQTKPRKGLKDARID